MTGIIEVLAGWIKNEPCIGYLRIENIRSTETQSFEYDEGWLSANAGLLLSPDLVPVRGRQYPARGRSSFGFLSDSAPDRWGRRLIERREVADARREGRGPRKLFESDYLLGVNDEGRSGGLRFRNVQDMSFFSIRSDQKAPPMEKLRELENAVEGLEKSGGDKWLNMLLEPGSSLGGARPKANVVDPKGALWIAKFPSRHDEHNNGAWEMVAHELAKSCGIQVSEARSIALSERGKTFMSKRFDRISSHNAISRIHFASAMTMLNETDGSDSVISYLDIAEAIEKISTTPKEDLHELWRRLVFNICVGNTDDHLRNHGFLLTNNPCWQLSPAFDLNPSPDRGWLSLCITDADPTKDIRLALSTASHYRLKEQEAKEEAARISKTVKKNWRYLAERQGIDARERKLMEPAFSEAERFS